MQRPDLAQAIGADPDRDEKGRRLERYVAMLLEWNGHINLVSKASEGEVWARHIEDCAQIADHLPMTGRWVDVGSGGGLPGLVLAIIGEPDLKMTLVEADGRKCAFLDAVRRDLRLAVTVEHRRHPIDAPIDADVVTSRAMAPLTNILGSLARSSNRSITGVFLKGRTWRDEVDEAKKRWSFDHDTIPSRTESGSAIIKVTNVAPG